MSIPVPKKRDRGFTVMGAVGNCIKKGGFFTSEIKTDGKIFRAFIRELVKKLDTDTKNKYENIKPWILLVSELTILTTIFFIRTTIPATGQRKAERQ